MTVRYPIASVHGRFQPPHLEHMSYILTAFDRADYLHIGITQFERKHMLPVPGAGSHREDDASNPLTYFERAELLNLALGAEGISADRFRIGPFPIERKEDLPDFLPLDVPILTTRVDAWNDRKVDLLRGCGYDVHVLFDRDPRGVSGSDLRQLIYQHDDRWTSMVPASTVEYLKSLELASRLHTKA